MAKTKPIGVRFDEDLLNEFKEQKLADTPQGVLSLLETYYKTAKTDFVTPLKKITSIWEIENEKIKENNKPENKAKIEAERNGTANSTQKDFKQPLLPSEMSDKPIRSNFKDGFDYSIALAEWKEKQKAT